MNRTFCPAHTASGRDRSAHQALRTLQNVLWAKRLYWMLDIVICKYFDSIPRSHLRAFLDQRVTDGVIRRMIDKWLKAGAVGEPDKDALPSETRFHHGREPFVQHMVREDVQEAGRDDTPLRGALGRAAQETVFDDGVRQHR